MRRIRKRDRRAERSGTADDDLPQRVCRVAVQRNFQSAMRAPVVAELARDPHGNRRGAVIFQICIVVQCHFGIDHRLTDGKVVELHVVDERICIIARVVRGIVAVLDRSNLEFLGHGHRRGFVNFQHPIDIEANPVCRLDNRIDMLLGCRIAYLNSFANKPILAGKRDGIIACACD